MSAWVYEFFEDLERDAMEREEKLQRVCVMPGCRKDKNGSDAQFCAYHQQQPHDNPGRALDSNLPGLWQSMGLGIGIYCNIGTTEPVYLSGFLRVPTKADFEGAIRFLQCLQEKAPE